MKKMALICLILSLLASNAQAVKLSYTIDDQIASEIIDTVVTYNPVPQTCDENGENCVNDYTDAQWTRLVLLQQLKSYVRTLERRKKITQADTGYEYADNLS